MKKVSLILINLFLIFGLASGASALLLTDTTIFTATTVTTDENGTNTSDVIDYGWGDVNVLDGIFNYEDGLLPLGSDYVAWAHQYTFVPAAATINSAELVLTFSDDENDIWYRLRTLEAGFGIAESFEWDVDEVDAGGYEYDIDVDYVGDGYFKILVGSLGGDFSIVSSVLTVDYDAAAPVPEPATMLLLGTGLVGLAVTSRKKIFKKK